MRCSSQLEYVADYDYVLVHYSVGKGNKRPISVIIDRGVLLNQISELICKGMPAVFEDQGERYQVTTLSPPDDECILDESQTALDDYTVSTDELCEYCGLPVKMGVDGFYHCPGCGRWVG